MIKLRETIEEGIGDIDYQIDDVDYQITSSAHCSPCSGFPRS